MIILVSFAQCPFGPSEPSPLREDGQTLSYDSTKLNDTNNTYSNTNDTNALSIIIIMIITCLPYVLLLLTLIMISIHYCYTKIRY